MKISVAAAVVALAILAALPALLDHERRPLDESVRDEAPGEFVEITDGRVHYEVTGSAGDPLLVMVHGFNGPLTTWDRNVDALAAAGYQVLAYDLFGRGYSDRPRLTYDLDLFCRQLGEMLDALGARYEFSLIGSSFGAVVASEFTLRNPDRVNSLILVGPAGFSSPADRSAWLLNIPLLSEYLYSIIGDRMMKSLTRRYYVDPERYPEAHQDFATQISIDGYKRAALSTLRHSPLRDYASGWQRVGALGKLLLLIWGRQDVSFPYANHAAALRLMPQARLVTVEQAAHLPQYEQPETVNAAILDFLSNTQ